MVKAQPGIGRNAHTDELRAMHGALKGMAPAKGSEAFSLLCSLGALLDPHRKPPGAEKVRRLRERFRAIQRPDGRNDLFTNQQPLRAAAQVQSPSRQEAPCQVQTSALTGEPKNFPPDWRAAYVMWSAKMTEKCKDDPLLRKVVQDMIESLWECFEAEVEGRR